MLPASINQALVNYDYPTIQARNALIPALALGVHQLGVSLMREGGAAVIPWQRSNTRWRRINLTAGLCDGC
jgi:hypothetical protein